MLFSYGSGQQQMDNNEKCRRIANDFDCHADGSRRDDTAEALNRWQHPVALSEALDVLHQVMRPASYRCICMAIKIASDLPTFSRCCQFVVAHNQS
jgi:hypothetical protein